MTADVVTTLLPVLRDSRMAGFNVFDVMHHGTHEKQLSNVFRWLLDIEGTHGLGGLFQGIFLEEVNRGFGGSQSLGPGPYLVGQEVNTAAPGEGDDIADLVLEGDEAVIVVENFHTSDGHGHSYERYLRFSRRDGRRGGVVLLCRDEDRGLLADGWENASVVTYGTLVDRLYHEVDRDRRYRSRYPDTHWFIVQMHRKFTRGKTVAEDRELLDFVAAMCTTGEARRYQEKSPDLAAQRFADDVAQQAVRRFGDSRELLQRVKARLRAYSADVLRGQLNATLGQDFVSSVGATYAGIYQWTVNFDIDDGGGSFDEARLQVKFGPSAWYANESDRNWLRTVDRGDADYSHLFLTRARTREVRQSAVSLADVLDGLDGDDRRLHDEILDLLRSSG